MTSTTAEENEILEFLPPIVPSIGFTRENPVDNCSTSKPTHWNDNYNGSASVRSQQNSASPNIVVINNNSEIEKETKSDEDALNSKVPLTVKIGTRHIQTNFQPRQWAWKSFNSSARHDNATFSHWVRSNIEYADYPYARFDANLDKLVYTDEEYEHFLSMDNGAVELEQTINIGPSKDLLVPGVESQPGKSNSVETTTKPPPTPNCIIEEYNQLVESDPRSNKILPWTREETDTLVEMCHRYDLRWPVIIDKWHEKFRPREEEGKNESDKNDGGKKRTTVRTIESLRKVEDLQHRYYQVGNILAQKRMEAIMAAEVANLSGGGVGGTAIDPGASLLGSDIISSGAASTSASSVNAQTKTAMAQFVDQHPPIHPSEVEGLKQIHQQTSLHPSLAPPLSIPGTGTVHRGNGKPFDLSAERARRRQLDYIWNRSKEEEIEEMELRAELRAVEAQLRKLKKMNRHLVPSGKSPISSSVMDTSTLPHSKKHHNPHPITSVDPYFYSNPEDMVDASFQATAPQPTPGTPYLQSGRLFPPAIGGHVGLNKQTLKQMDAILKELGVPVEPIATKRSMDLYDGVRKDALTLLVLQKMVMKKEAEVISKRTKLIKLKGEGVASESLQTEKKDAEKKTAINQTGTAESSSSTEKSGAVVALLPPAGLAGGTGATSATSGGGKKANASGGGNKCAKAPKRPREESVASSGFAPTVAAPVGASSAPTGKSAGKKGPGTTGRKKSRKSASSGRDAKKGNTSTCVPKAIAHLSSSGGIVEVPKIPPETAIMTSSAAGSVHPNQLVAIAPVVNTPAAVQPSAVNDSFTLTASHGSLPNSAPMPTPLPVSSPGKTTGKKRSKKSSLSNKK
ncbi:hypothetical protein ACHAXS_007533 [Conticribra weissflogii]